MPTKWIYGANLTNKLITLFWELSQDEIVLLQLEEIFKSNNSEAIISSIMGIDE